MAELDPIANALKALRDKRGKLMAEVRRIDAGLKALESLNGGEQEVAPRSDLSSVDIAVEILTERDSWTHLKELYIVAEKRGVKAQKRSFASSLHREAGGDDGVIIRHSKKASFFGLPAWKERDSR